MMDQQSANATTHHPRTLFDKVWDRHTIRRRMEVDGLPDTLYIDLHLVHEVTSPQAFAELRKRNLEVRRPAQTVATMDHSIPTTPLGADGIIAVTDSRAAAQLEQLQRNCTDFGVPIHPMGSQHQGIVHVMAPELGLSQPGMTIVCGDSHTSTHGAFGALAFGIGTGQVAHVLATQCLLMTRPRTFALIIDGALNPGVTAKDLILAIIARLGTEAGTGHVFEYRGSTISDLDMDSRMTICNMSIEAGARAGMIAPDTTTYQYLESRGHSPTGEEWDRKVADWRTLPTDEGAQFGREARFDAGQLQPMITYGTGPGMGMPIRDAVPDPATFADAGQRETARKALEYMRIEPGKPLLGHPIDVVFVGSCTNGRISDLRLAARILQGRKVHHRVRMLVVPGSQSVKRAAEHEKLHEIFLAAGAEWREPGCSMCLAMNGDQLEPGQLSVSTSNRNFEGRQGPGGRTILASPLTAAACAVTGRVSDVREMM